VTLYVEAGYDLADLGGYELAVVETGGNTFTVSLPTGKHFLRTNGATVSIFGDFTAMVTPYTDLVGAIETALNLGTAAGAYSVAFDPTTQRVTIAHDGTAPVTAVALTGLTTPGLIGQTVAHSGALSHEMDRTPDYWISGSIGFWSDYHEREGVEDIGFTVAQRAPARRRERGRIDGTEPDRAARAARDRLHRAQRRLRPLDVAKALPPRAQRRSDRDR